MDSDTGSATSANITNNKLSHGFCEVFLPKKSNLNLDSNNNLQKVQRTEENIKRHPGVAISKIYIVGTSVG